MNNFFGKYKGFVRDNVDPENRGRVRCFCPQVMGPVDDTTHWLDWAQACLPWFGGLNTLDFGPPLTKQQNGGVEVIVWLEFEMGEVDHPIWVGTLLPAPSKADPNAQIDLTQAGGQTGGDIVVTPPAGSSLADINPTQPQPGTNETRMVVKEGREIIIGSAQGGYIAIGPYGVSLTGVQILQNGKLTIASFADKVSG